jgi:hypothetical protein
MRIRWLLGSLGVAACTFELAPLEDPNADAGNASGASGGMSPDSGTAGAAGFGLVAGTSGTSGTSGAGGGFGGGAGVGGSVAGSSGLGGNPSGGWSGTGGTGTGGGSGGGGGVCSPGTVVVLGACAKCGTLTRTCGANGQWGANACQNQGVCEPGTLGPAVCNDTCEEQRCTFTCTWSKCQLEPGATCAWKNGANYRCCGPDQWQFCSQVSCDWFPCESCGSNSGCKAEC